MAEGSGGDSRPVEAVLASIRRVLDTELAARAALETGDRPRGGSGGSVEPLRPAHGLSMPAGEEAVSQWLEANLRPMVVDWLDRNMPGLLEPLIREEIRTMMGRADRDAS